MQKTKYQRKTSWLVKLLVDAAAASQQLVPRQEQVEAAGLTGKPIGMTANYPVTPNDWQKCPAHVTTVGI